MATLFLYSCQSLKTRSQVSSGTMSPPSATATTPSVDSGVETEAPVPSATSDVVLREPPRIGVILSAGGAKTLASLQVFRDLQAAKIPIHSVAGIEMGAYAAALFARNKLPNDLDWQFSKLENINWASESGRESLLKLISLAWGQENIDQLKAPFACPSVHLGRQQKYVLAKGQVKQALSYCLPYWPLFTPFDSSVAGLNEVKSLVDYLRSRGANYIIFVNFLSSETRTPRAFTRKFDTAENSAWVEASISYRNLIGVDYSLVIDTDSYGIMNFDKKREIMGLGQEPTQKMIKHLQNKFGL